MIYIMFIIIIVVIILFFTSVITYLSFGKISKGAEMLDTVKCFQLTLIVFYAA